MENCLGEEMISAFEVQLNNRLFSTSFLISLAHLDCVTKRFVALLKHHVLLPIIGCNLTFLWKL